MARPDTFWLTLTNIVLGALVVLCVLIMVLGTLCETLEELRRRRSYGDELDHDMQEMFAAPRRSAGALRTGLCGRLQRLREAACLIWRQLSHRL